MVGVDDVQGAGTLPEQVGGPDERTSGGLGVIEADDQGDGLNRTADGSAVRPGGLDNVGYGIGNWCQDRLGQFE
jgi:hypothetical protein